MDWIFGGFMDVMKGFNPKFAPFVTPRLAVIINGLQLVLCVIAMVVAKNLPVFSMSMRVCCSSMP